MKQICEIRKRPSAWTIVGTPFFIALIGTCLLVGLQFIVDSIWLNGFLIKTLAIAIFLATVFVWKLEVRIQVERSEKKFVAIRRLFVFKMRVGQRRFDGLDDVYWKKEESVEQDGSQYHVYGRRRVAGGDLDSIQDVLISGGVAHLISLTPDDVTQLRSGFCELRDAE